MKIEGLVLRLGGRPSVRLPISSVLAGCAASRTSRQFSATKAKERVS